MIRYCARPCFASENLRWNGKWLIYRLPKPNHNGQTFIQLEPIEFLEKIVAFIPSPHRHRHHYHGVFAPNSSVRKKVAANAKKRIEHIVPPFVKEAAEKVEKVSFNWAKLIAGIYEAAIPMLLIIYGGQKAINSSRNLSAYSEFIRKGFGVLMILTALAIASHYDVKLQQLTLEYFPFLNIDDNALVKPELDKLRSKSEINLNKSFILPSETSTTKEGEILPKIAAVPELMGITGWVNTEPFTLEQLRGKVVLIDFWTYSCINCIRTFPYLKDWYANYKDKGLVIVGVHTPEFEFEKNPENVKDAVKRFGLFYPIAIDSDFKTWLNFNNHFWPAHYLVDQTGIVRSFHFGEGAYVQTENDIRNLLGMPPLTKAEPVATVRPLTPETYLGFARGDRYTSENTIQRNVTFDYKYSEKLKDNRVALKGNWLVSSEKITSMDDNSTLDLNFLATRVYLVMDSDKSQAITVYLDDIPLEKKYYTSDMNSEGQILVKEPRKYDVIDLKTQYGRHKLTLQVPKGVSLYAFTFGDEPMYTVGH